MFRALGGAAVLCALAVFAAGLGPARQNKSKKPESKDSAVAAGARLYKRNCAVCHGNDGRGGSAPPPSSRFIKPAPDLTALAQRHNGKFPEEYVVRVLRSGVKMPDHGRSEMPVWGTIFKATTKSDEAEVNQRIADLTAYLKSLQAK